MNFSYRNSFRWQQVLFCLSFFVCLNATAFADEYGFGFWTTASGLPQNTVNGIARTPDGYLWLAAFDGLARFDGVRFTVFDKGSSRGVVNNRFRGIFADRDGAVWALFLSAAVCVKL